VDLAADAVLLMVGYEINLNGTGSRHKGLRPQTFDGVFWSSNEVSSCQIVITDQIRGSKVFSMSLLVRVCKLVPNLCHIDDQILTQTFLLQIHLI